MAELSQKTIAVLGSTGSVGTQSLDVARAGNMKVDYISGNSNLRLLEEQIREFHPRYCAVADEKNAKLLALSVADTDTKILSGADGVCEGIFLSGAEAVVNSILGEAGLAPTLAVIESGKRLALSNKESLVIAGDIVMAKVKEKHTQIIPVDSEHSAIFQSLVGNSNREIKKILLTASGGPFFGKDKDFLRGVMKSDVLAHPTWKMGAKITVDSATMMNKGFEVIEAAHLFSVKAEQIQVLVHRESILHSAVEYIDNAVIAQLGTPDMRLCVQYALTYPERAQSPVRELDLFELGALTFARPDTQTFSLLSLAYRALEDKGAMGAVINASNEVAVAAHLSDALPFYRISELVAQCYEQMSYAKKYTSLEDIIASDREARRITQSLID